MNKRIELIERLLEMVERPDVTEQDLQVANAVAEELLAQLSIELDKFIKYSA